jgi:hypothetical protein
MDTRPNNLAKFKAEALEICLSRIEAGASLEEALRPYGSLGSELRPLVEIALANRAYAASLAAPKSSLTRSRARFMNAAQANAERSQRRWFGGIAFSRLGFAALAFLLVLIIGGFSTAAASAKALPGDILYPVKLASEQTRLFLTADPHDRLTLEKSFDERRAQEILELLKRDRSEIVRLGGEVTRIQPGEWIVRDTIVWLDSSTQLEHEIEIGFYVEVTGPLRSDGSVLAQTIRARQIIFSGTVDATGSGQWVIDGLAVQVTSRTRWSGKPELGSRVTVTAFVLADGSLQASQVQVGTASGAEVTWTSEPGASPTATFTPTPTISPTSTPTQISKQDEPSTMDNGNDNDNDNENHNDNDHDDDDDDNDNDNDNDNDDD